VPFFWNAVYITVVLRPAFSINLHQRFLKQEVLAASTILSGSLFQRLTTRTVMEEVCSYTATRSRQMEMQEHSDAVDDRCFRSLQLTADAQVIK